MAATVTAMGIVDEDLAAVRSATDLVAVVSQYTQLKRSGRQWSGLCPFHTERTPSFYVNQELGLFHCWGCQAKGDAITFVRDIEHLDFVAAVERLAARAGMVLRYTERDQTERRRRRTSLVEAMSIAVDWYHERLRAAPDAAGARRYLRERGLDAGDVRDFRLGWAPEGWDELVRGVRIPPEDLLTLDLARRGRHGLVDRFRGRILFPVFDPAGDPVGFGGRVLPGSAERAKYVNTSETPLYRKSQLLYGLDRAKARIVSDDRAVVCEGYTDVIAFARAGLPAAVATCGTALTEDHVRLLGRYARRIVLAFDADAAGLAAVDRVYEWERTHELEFAVADLPAGVDPAELGARDPAALVAAVDAARPFLAFRLERTLAGGDLSTAEGRARTAERAVAVIAEHPGELVRDQYLMVVADRCRVDVSRLRHAVAGAVGAGTRPHERGPRAGGAPRGARRGGPELEALRHLVHGWDQMASWVHEAMFDDPDNVAALDCLASHASVAEAVEAADPEVGDLLARLAVEPPDSDPFDVVIRLCSAAGRRRSEELRRHLQADPADLDSLRTQQWLAGTLAALDDPDRRTAAAAELVAWLGSRGEEGA